MANKHYINTQSLVPASGSTFFIGSGDSRFNKFFLKDEINYDPELLLKETGTTRVSIASGGNVGINETNPSSQLHVKGGGTTSSSSSFIAEDSGGNTLMKLFDSGQVGINTTDFSDILGGGSEAQLSFAHAGWRWQLRGNNVLHGDGTIQRGISVGGNSKFRTGTFTAHPYSIATNGGDRLQIEPDGRIGLRGDPSGTSAMPSTSGILFGKETVVVQSFILKNNRIINTDGETRSSANQIFRGVYDSDATTGVTESAIDATIQHIVEDTSPTTRIAHSVGGNEYLTIRNSGNVGINKTSGLGAKLNIKGEGSTSSTSSLLVENSGGSVGLRVRDDNVVTSNDGIFLAEEGGGFIADAAGLRRVGLIKVDQGGPRLRYTQSNNFRLQYSPQGLFSSSGHEDVLSFLGTKVDVWKDWNVKTGAGVFIEDGANFAIGMNNTETPDRVADIRGDFQMGVDDAHSGTTIRSSNTLFLRGKYWDGSVSQSVDSSIKHVVEDTSGNSRVAHSVGGNEYLTIRNSGNIGINKTSNLGAKLNIKGEGSTSSTSSFIAEDSGGNTLMKVEDGGNVGVGTNNPSFKFDIDTPTDNGLILKDGGNTMATLFSVSNTGGRLILKDSIGSSQVVQLNSSDGNDQVLNNFGVGTSPDSPKGAKFHVDVASSGGILLTKGNNNRASLYNDTNSGGRLFLFDTAGNVVTRLNQDGENIIDNGQNLKLGNKLGVGRSPAAGVLDIDGDIYARPNTSDLPDNGTVNSHNLILRGYYDSDATATINVTPQDATVQYIVENTSGDSRLATSINGNELLSLTNEGRLGVRTTDFTNDFFELGGVGSSDGVGVFAVEQYGNRWVIEGSTFTITTGTIVTRLSQGNLVTVTDHPFGLGTNFDEKLTIASDAGGGAVALGFNPENHTVTNDNNGSFATFGGPIIPYSDIAFIGGGAPISDGGFENSSKGIFRIRYDSDSSSGVTESTVDATIQHVFEDDSPTTRVRHMIDGNEYLTIRNSGNVGINKTSGLGARLHVKGEGSTSSTSSFIAEDSGGNTLMKVEDGGNVGINNTSPAYPLDVISSSNAIHATDGGTRKVLIQTSVAGADADTVGAGIGISRVSDGSFSDGHKIFDFKTPAGAGGWMGIQNRSGTQFKNWNGSANRLLIDTVNRVIGIGSGIDIDDLSGTAGARVAIVDTAGGGDGSLFRVEGTTSGKEEFTVREEIGVGVNLGGLDPAAQLNVKGEGSTSSTSSFVAENSGGNTLMKVEDGGNVGINKTSGLDARLHIQGETSDNSSRSLVAEDSSGNSILSVRNNGFVGIGELNPSALLDVQGTSGDVIRLVGDSGGLARFAIDGSNRGGLLLGTSNEVIIKAKDGAGQGRAKFDIENDMSLTVNDGEGLEISNVDRSVESVSLGARNTGQGQLSLRDNSGNILVSLNADGTGGNSIPKILHSQSIVFGQPSSNEGNAIAGLSIMDKDMALHPDGANLTDNSTLNSQTLQFRGYYDSDATSGISVTARDFTFQNRVEDTSGNARLAVVADGGGFTSIEPLTIRNSGNIGINKTSNLNARLHVQGEGSTDATSSFIAEDSGGNTLMKVEDGGNVGIGKTPSTLLDIQAISNQKNNVRIVNASGTGQSSLLVQSDDRAGLSAGDKGGSTDIRLLEKSTTGQGKALFDIENNLDLIGRPSHAVNVTNINNGVEVAGIGIHGGTGGGQVFLRDSSASTVVQIRSQGSSKVLNPGDFVIGTPSTNPSNTSVLGLNVMDKDMALHQDHGNLTDNSTLNSQTLQFRGYYDLDSTTGVTATAQDATVQHIVENTSGDSRLAMSVDGTEHASLSNSGVFKTSNLWSEGSIRSGIKRVTGSYTATTEDHTLLGNASGGAVDISLPDPQNTPDIEFYLKKIDSSGNNVNITTINSRNIDGDTTKSISTQYNSIIVQSDGLQYWIF